METCNAITSSLLYLSDDEGEKFIFKPLDKDTDLNDLPIILHTNWKLD